MYIRKNSVLRGEVSIDEPLNIDWDGNELLLSDVIGTDGTREQRIEKNEDERTIRNAVAQLGERERIHHRAALRSERRGRSARRRSRRICWHLAIVHFRLEKKIIRRLKEKIETKI